MRVVSNERVIFFDVDDTLVLYPSTSPDEETIVVIDPYDGKAVRRVPHLPHIKLLKNYKARGGEVIVWSKNGVRWAQAVINCLKLTKHVDQVMCKPIAFVDDQQAVKWMGEHVFIPSTDSFGRE